MVNGTQNHVHISQIRKSNEQILGFKNVIFVNNKPNIKSKDIEIKSSPYLTRSRVKLIK